MVNPHRHLRRRPLELEPITEVAVDDADNDNEAAAGACHDHQVYNSTPASADDLQPKEHVIPYNGIMFEVRSNHLPVVISTLELYLLREFDATTGDYTDDLSLKVYTKVGSYEGTAVSDKSQWTCVADTQLKLLSKRLGLIPTANFTAVQIPPWSLHSFYVTGTSVNGPWLASRVHEENQIGVLEASIAGGVLDIFSGVALDQPDFGAEHHLPQVSPMYTGALFVSAQLDCRNPIVHEFVMDYPYVVDFADPKVLEGYALGRFNHTISTQLVSPKNPTLLDYRDNHGLQKKSNVTLIVGPLSVACPIDWTHCKTMTLRVLFQYHNTISTGDVEFELYSLSSVVAKEFEYELANVCPVQYLGNTTVLANYQFTLSHVSGEMAKTQKDFLATSLTGYLDKALTGSTEIKVGNETMVDESATTVSSLRIYKQELPPDIRRLRGSARGLEETDLTVSGQVLGLQLARQADPTVFESKVQTAMQDGDAIQQTLEVNQMLPEYSYMADDPFFKEAAVSDALVEPAPPRSVIPTATPTLPQPTGVPSWTSAPVGATTQPTAWPTPSLASKTTWSPTLLPVATVAVADDAATIPPGANDATTSQPTPLQDASTVPPQSPDEPTPPPQNSDGRNSLVWILLGVGLGIVVLLLLLWCWCEKREKKPPASPPAAEDKDVPPSAVGPDPTEVEETHKEDDDNSLHQPLNQQQGDDEGEPPSRRNMLRRDMNDPQFQSQYSISQPMLSEHQEDQPEQEQPRPRRGRRPRPTASQQTQEDDEKPENKVYRDALAKAEQMKVKDLKRECQNRGIDTANFVDKSELCKAYAQQASQNASLRSSFASAAGSRPPPAMSYAQIVDQANQMRVKELKQKLTAMGVSTSRVLDKEALVDSYAHAVLAEQMR